MKLFNITAETPKEVVFNLFAEEFVTRFFEFKSIEDTQKKVSNLNVLAEEVGRNKLGAYMEWSIKNLAVELNNPRVQEFFHKSFGSQLESKYYPTELENYINR